MRSSRSAPARDLSIYSLFAFLWAMSMIWHYLRPENNYPVGMTDLLVVFTAILVLIRPQNPHFLVALSSSNVLVFLSSQPSGSNHWMMQFFVNLVLLVSFAHLVHKRRMLQIDNDEWLEGFRPTICLLVLLLYFFASFHKLNSGYFSEHSFALRFYRDIVFGIQMQPFSHLFPMDEALLSVLPHLSVLTEILIPILLFFKPTRVLGILIGMCFHVFLSFKEFPHGTDFPTLLGAAYILFLPDEAVAVIRRSILAKVRSSYLYDLFKRVLFPAILLSLIFAPAMYSLNRSNNITLFSFDNLKSHHWAIYALSYLGTLLFLLKRLKRADYSKGTMIAGHIPYYLLWIPMLFVFVAVSPYLGLRTRSAFAMFSNLETEGNYANHFFVPLGIQVFDYQKQVCVKETSAEAIPNTALTGRLLPYYRFLRMTRENPEASITYTFEGERFELGRIADKPELVAEPDWFERHYLVFQSTDWDNKTTYCDWRR